MSRGLKESLGATAPLITGMQEADIAEVQQIERESNLSPWSIEGYRSELNNPDSVCLVAKIENKIIGFIIARLIMSSNSAEIYNIGVKLTHRGCKIGSRLLNDLQNLCISNNLDDIFLEVRKTNSTAIEFYKKQRFEISYIRKNFYNNPREDAYVMLKKIN